jgi:hypothetical protein
MLLALVIRSFDRMTVVEAAVVIAIIITIECLLLPGVAADHSRRNWLRERDAPNTVIAPPNITLASLSRSERRL